MQSGKPATEAGENQMIAATAYTIETLLQGQGFGIEDCCVASPRPILDLFVVGWVLVMTL